LAPQEISSSEAITEMELSEKGVDPIAKTPTTAWMGCMGGYSILFLTSARCGESIK
jgi:hypothetical protein